MADKSTVDVFDDDDFNALVTAHEDEDEDSLPSSSISKISVDGEHGNVLARSAHIKSADNLALVRVSYRVAWTG